MLEVRLLGGLSVTLDGRPAELPADARARELLARLALSPGPQTRSALAGRLRPDVPEESARKSLRNALYELRRALGADAVMVSGDRIQLAEPARVDVREFRRLVAEGDLEAAVEVGRGELVDGFDGDWALRARDEHTAELAASLGALAARAEERGDIAAAVGWARRRLEVEPLAEAAHRELIRLLAVGGDRPAALAAARVMSDRLRTELGIPPSAATRALVQDVRRARIPLADGPSMVSLPELPAALAAAEHPEGRGPALARLEQAWADAVAGRPQFASIAGEPGIGKTTLAGELARRVHAQGGAVLLGRSDEHALVPFEPWIEALERLLDALPDGEADHWLTEHDGALARLLPARSPGQSTPGGPREHYLAFELVGALLEDVASRWPVLLVLDDLHWADEDSLSLLRHLARSDMRARVLTLLCVRSAELGPLAAETLSDLRRAGPLVHMQLAGLDDDAVTAVIARRTGRADPDAARRYRARSGGNPFFLDELLREEQEAGHESSGPPAGVRDVIGRRLARLEDPTMHALEVAAMCGLEFDLTTLARVAGRPLFETLETLDSAIEAALVAATDRQGRYAFSHALVGETISSGLPASRRAGLHTEIARVLAGRHAAGEVGAAEVVRHLRGAGALATDEEVARWEVTAAREASAALAHADAAAHYEAGLAAGQSPERGEMLVALGEAHERAGRREPARSAFLRAAQLASTTGDASLLARSALGHGGTAVVIAAADPTTVSLLEEALAATAASDLAMSARLLARLSVELYYADRERARELSALAVERARDAGDASALAAALNARRVALWSPQHVDERLAVAGEMVAAAESAGDLEMVLQGRNWRVVDLLELGRVSEVAAEIDAYEALAEAVALPHFRWYVPLWRATLCLLAGRWAQAAELSDRALAIGRQADDPNAPLFHGIQHRTSFRLAARDLDRERIVEGGATSPASAEWEVYLALIDASRGATQEARRRVSELSRDGALGMDANWHGACILADAAVMIGDREAAGALYGLLEPHAHLFPVIARAISCLGSAELHVGRLAGLLGRQDEAVARLRRAVAENDRIGAEPFASTALLRLGEGLAAAGDQDAAGDALGQAIERAESIEMTYVVDEARRLRERIAV